MYSTEEIAELEREVLAATKKAQKFLRDGQGHLAEAQLHRATDLIMQMNRAIADVHNAKSCPECHTTNCHRKNGNPYCSTTLAPGWRERVYN